MQARDIMTSPVISVGPRTHVIHVAALLRERHIGGVPVLAGGRLVGIVTERDLLYRHELGTQHRSDTPAWWRRVLAPGMEPDWYVKSHGSCAEHVMTRMVVVAEPHTELPDVLALFERHRIGRVPVVRDALLVGILTSADLVRALAQGTWVPASREAANTDDEIRARLDSELRRQDWWNSGSCAVAVRLGVVRFTGFVENESQRRASLVAAENVPGVRAVEDERASLAELPLMF